MSPRDSDELREIAEIQAQLARIEEQELIRAEAALFSSSLAEFVKAAWAIIEPGRPLKWNWHHDLICAELEMFARRQVVEGRPYTRGILNVPPRHTKSTIVSVCFPAWVWTWAPNHQFLCLSHSGDLAVRDAVKARRLMESNWYVDRFRSEHWSKAWQFTGDQNVKSYYENDRGGHRLSQGMTAKVTGKGGDSILIDDPHDANDAQSDLERTKVIDNYDNGIESRLNDQATGGIFGIMQRLHHADWCGHVLKKDGRKVWRVTCLPQEYEDDHPLVCDRDKRTKHGELLWPEGVPAHVVKRQKETWPVMTYAGQAQQRPTPKAGGILPRDQWREWDVELMGPIPSCDYIIDSWDTAFSKDDMKKGKSSRSALSRWGVFFNEKKNRHCIMLLFSWAKHVDYPTLRKKAREEYLEHKPDTVLIEKKASGQSLIQDLRASGVPVVGYNPDKDKVARAHAVSALLESGMVYYPKPKGRAVPKWAEEHIEECAMFPVGQYSDLVDTTTQAWLRIRNSWRVEHPANPDPPHPDDEDRDDAELGEARPFYG